MKCMHNLGWTLEKVYKTKNQITLSTNNKICINRVTTFITVTAPCYACGGELHVDQKNDKLNHLTPKNLPLEERPYGCSS